VSKLKGRTDPENDYERERESEDTFRLEMLGKRDSSVSQFERRKKKPERETEREREMSTFRERESASETACVFEGESDFACFKG